MNEAFQYKPVLVHKLWTITHRGDFLVWWWKCNRTCSFFCRIKLRKYCQGRIKCYVSPKWCSSKINCVYDDVFGTLQLHNNNFIEPK